MQPVANMLKRTAGGRLQVDRPQHPTAVLPDWDSQQASFIHRHPAAPREGRRAQTVQTTIEIELPPPLIFKGREIEEVVLRSSQATQRPQLPSTPIGLLVVLMVMGVLGALSQRGLAALLTTTGALQRQWRGWT